MIAATLLEVLQAFADAVVFRQVHREQRLPEGARITGLYLGRPWVHVTWNQP